MLYRTAISHQIAGKPVRISCHIIILYTFFETTGIICHSNLPEKIFKQQFSCTHENMYWVSQKKKYTSLKSKIFVLKAGQSVKLVQTNPQLRFGLSKSDKN